MTKQNKHWYIKFHEFLTPKLIVIWLLSIPIIIIYVKFFAEAELKDLKVIDQFYVYYAIDSTTTKAIIVKDEDIIDKIEIYRQIINNKTNIAGDEIYMDTTSIPITEKVGVVKYMNDSSIAVIRFRNKFFEEDIRESNLNSKVAHGYVSVLDLHKQVSSR